MRPWARAATLALAAGVAAAVASMGLRQGDWLPGEPVAARTALLAPEIRLRLPEGEGPFPVALLFGGCDGPMDNLDRWAGMMVAEGWAAAIVDSHRPRGLDRGPLWRLMCAGLVLQGGERAGDVLAAIGWARGEAALDAGRIVLLGSSHGGWAVMEFLAGKVGGVRGLPEGMADARDGVVGALLLYPYCGRLNRARDGWTEEVPLLAILSGVDAIAPTEACAAILARVTGPVETVVLEGVGHGFDQEVRARLSWLVHDARATAEALALGAAFLGRLDARP